MSRVYDERVCALGEGPLWHPLRKQLFWFDILGKRLLSREGEAPLEWAFDEYVSAAGWVDRETLILASETGLWRFDPGSGQRDLLVPLEADNMATRSNDGRADPQGGFWIGTMGKGAEPKAGAIYRYYRGELRKLVPDVSISNAICFAPGGGLGYYTDTLSGRVMRWALDRDTGWPIGAAEVFVDQRAEGLNPDGAVTDAEGNVWIAQWGASRVAAYAPDGTFLRAVGVGGRHSSCPAFGGAEMTSLFCTTALEHLSPEVVAAEPQNGMTFVCENVTRGQAEPAVIL
ncbi:SMP-30/gluconolactonase/LRE family protein [Thiosulfatihalobacter marinus]|uniref:SMP-30/gluconolactonase/LRE family protein n=1 Tax=Thiosulfatihalobacter marinus TaxID=2792481 RepID=UPI0018D8D012|nr:SMP-30/gluconolactonase/LRE family protein [Thiosulfatihalobacter marinus]